MLLLNGMVGPLLDAGWYYWILGIIIRCHCSVPCGKIPLLEIGYYNKVPLLDTIC